MRGGRRPQARTSMTSDADRAPGGPGPLDRPPGGRTPGRDNQRRRLLIGIAAALVIGVLLALLLRPNLEQDGGRDGERATRVSNEDEGFTFDIKKAGEPYRAPDRDAVAQAYAKAGEIYGAQGV